MKIRVNGVEKTMDISTVENLGNVLAGLNLPPTQLITSIRLNDRPLEPDWLQKQDRIYVMNEDEMDIDAEDAAAIGNRAFQDSKEQLGRLIEDLQQTAEGFRLDEETTANARLVQSIENMQAFFTVIQEAFVLMGRDFNTTPIGETKGQDYIKTFSGKLSELIDVQQTKDWVLLADMIEYELVPVLKKVEKIYG